MPPHHRENPGHTQEGEAIRFRGGPETQAPTLVVAEVSGRADLWNVRWDFVGCDQACSNRFDLYSADRFACLAATTGLPGGNVGSGVPWWLSHARASCCLRSENRGGHPVCCDSPAHPPAPGGLKAWGTGIRCWRQAMGLSASDASRWIRDTPLFHKTHSPLLRKQKNLWSRTPTSAEPAWSGQGVA